MMKLMKVCAVALVAGSVFAPVPSQAGEINGKAIMCEKVPFGGGADSSASKKLDLHLKMLGLHLKAFKFEDDRVQAYQAPLILENSPELRIHDLGIYYVQPKEIEWERYNLDRETLILRAELADADKRLAGLDRVLADEFPQFAEIANPETFDIRRRYECELIDPDKIEAYFQPYIERRKAEDEKMYKGNKI